MALHMTTTQDKREDQPVGQQTAVPRTTPPEDREVPSVARNLSAAPQEVAVDCGWGRLIMAHTFSDSRRLAERLNDEGSGRRDIAMYVVDPHVVLAESPQSLFLDPSHTYRLSLASYSSTSLRHPNFVVRRLRNRSDASAINNLYACRHMVPVDEAFIWANRSSRILTYAVAEDFETGEIVGTATGVDHRHAFDDPENGASLWTVAVDSQCPYPGVGETLVRYLIEHYLERGRAYVDLSVMHDNRHAIALYEKLGFKRIHTFALKHKNPFNEPLFIGPEFDSGLNPYAEIIVNEARQRGIHVEILDASEGYFRLELGGRSVTCRESLTELTNAVAMSRCQNKRVTTKLLAEGGLKVPEQAVAGDLASSRAFLARHGAIVVKPALGEQGNGVAVNLRDIDEVEAAIEQARRYGEPVLLESFHRGDDLRVIVINFTVVAAALRRPAEIVGTGRHSISELIEKQSRRRAAATGGESRIPADTVTERCVTEQGWQLDSILPEGQTLVVRKTANLHTGGTIHDVTQRLHPDLRQVSETAARLLDIPVVGLDLLVPDVAGSEYVFIEANERPGLANHEPQPTAERFVDLLFPLSVKE